MDFKTLVTGAGGAAGADADALLVVLAGDSAPASLGKPLAAALQRCIDHGDFAFKAGRLTAWAARHPDMEVVETSPVFPVGFFKLVRIRRRPL